MFGKNYIRERVVINQRGVSLTQLLKNKHLSIFFYKASKSYKIIFEKHFVSFKTNIYLCVHKCKLLSAQKIDNSITLNSIVP